MSDKTKTIERNVVIKDINVHIKSVFGDKIPLTKALTNITIQKLSISRRNNNKDVEKIGDIWYNSHKWNIGLLFLREVK